MRLFGSAVTACFCNARKAFSYQLTRREEDNAAVYQALKGRTSMSTNFDASDLVEWYWGIPIPGGGNVSINKYLINHPSTELTRKQTSIASLYTAASGSGLSPRAAPFGRAKIGKATPEDFEHILGVGSDSGYFEKLKTTPQQWADSNLGVDCTGFAVAYFDALDRLAIGKGVYSGGVSCPWLLGTARKNNSSGDSDVLIWDFDDIEQDDIILWMYASGKESRSPGHISIIYDVDSATNLLYCAESNGSADKSAHSGPRYTERVWGGAKGSGGGKYIELDKGAVIIVRPPTRFP
jgi:hypothetical protein